MSFKDLALRNVNADGPFTDDRAMVSVDHSAVIANTGVGD